MITEQQLHILRHSLGLDENGGGQIYRNHYCAGPDVNRWEDLMALVRMGLLRDHGPIEMWGGNHGFTVTETGKDVAMGLIGECMPDESENPS